MKARIVILALIFSFPIALWSQSLASKGDSLLQALVTSNKCVGVAAAVGQGGTIKWEGAAGFSDQDDQTAFSTKTLNRTASIAKSMTAVAVMQLVEQGKIDLDEPIRSYLPHFPEKQKGTITVRHLLGHTSGIGAYEGKESENTTHFLSLEAAMNVFKDRPLLHEPGTAFHYTTYGYVVLGHIIEVVSKMDYEEYMRKHIWEKAGMKHTGVEHKDGQYENKSALYYRNSKGKIKESKYNDLSNRVPGGGFYSTVEDMLLFGEAVLNHELISEASFEEMIKQPSVKKEGNQFGYGWVLYGENPVMGNVIGHAGEQTGASNQIMLLPDEGIVIAVFSNTARAWKDVVVFSIELIHLSAELKSN